MKKVNLVFSDESGGLNGRNYYLRLALIINAEDYQKLTEKFIELKKEFSIPLEKELKFDFLWKIEKHRIDLNKNEESYFFKDWELDKLKAFIEKSVGLLSEFNIKIIAIFTYFFARLPKPLIEIEHDFLKTLMARLEYEFSKDESLGIIFYDESQNKDKISEAYKKVFVNSKYVKSYSHLKDSISFDISTYSSGIQIADYLSGVLHNFFRDYAFSKELFYRVIKPKLRKVYGYPMTKTGLIPIYLDGSKNGKALIEEIIKRVKLND